MDARVIDIIEDSTPNPTAEQRSNLSLLRNEDARVVVTGQQLGLLGGPLLSAYKILTAVKFAQVRSSAGSPTVPLFWLQSEDHDTVEINELSFISDDGRLVSTKLNSERLDPRNRLPVGKLSEFSELPLLLESMGFCSSLSPQTLLHNFRSAVNEFFGEHGLLFIDPLLLQASGLTVPIYQTALRSSEEIEQKLFAKERLMLVEGFDPTVKIRPNSPLFFFQTSTEQLSRYRLTRSDSSFVSPESNSSFSSEELEALIEREPTRFSSSALLRPIIQDSLLMPVAYVGGPAEERYLELASAAYDSFGVTRSEFVRRASILLVEPRVRRAIEKLGKIDLESLAMLTPESLVAKVREHAVGTNNEAELRTLLFSRIDTMFAEIELLFGTLGESGKAYLSRSREKFDRAATGIIDAYRSGYKDRVNRDTKASGLICDSLAPKGLDQERVLSWYPIFKKVGPTIVAAFLDKIELENLRERKTLVL
jgi:bacillithiol biosynthesis cysteine-adding enzyme BshC